MELDNLDIEILRENFDTETISMVDVENIHKIFSYLKDNNVYYLKDLLLLSLDLFLLPSDQFITQFEKLKSKLGKNYVDILGEDISLIEIMYEN